MGPRVSASSARSVSKSWSSAHASASNAAISQRCSSAGDRHRPEEPVARELDLALEGPRLGPLRENRVGTLAAAARVQALDDAAVVPERGLAPGCEEQIDAPPPPLGRDRRAQAEPERRPQRPEALADLDRPVLEGLGVRPRDPVDGAGDDELVDRSGVAIDELSQAFGRLCEAGSGVFEVADQAARERWVTRQPGAFALRSMVPGGSIPERASLVSTAAQQARARRPQQMGREKPSADRQPRRSVERRL